MGEYVFDNQLFDEWLDKKAQEILSKVDRATITTEEMIMLVLKAQTNHFHHMDVECRAEFSKIDMQFKKVDEKFDRLYRFMMWQGGAILALFGGIYLKLFLHP